MEDHLIRRICKVILAKYDVYEQDSKYDNIENTETNVDEMVDSVFYGLIYEKLDRN